MDVYGYHAYQYNQSEELAKQMFTQQQALTSSMPYNLSGVPQPHNMPAPPGTPWNVQGLPWGMSSPPQLVQFTAADSPTDAKATLVQHCKRKSLDVEPVIPAKQLITEEKMAATFNSLHISKDFTPHSLAADEVMDIGMEGPSTSSNITDRLKGHTIVLSEEVKKIREEPLLPAAIIERLEKPRMSLVVWKPREDILEKIIEDVDKDKKSSEEEQPVKRNGLLVAEYPGMDIEM